MGLTDVLRMGRYQKAIEASLSAPAFTGTPDPSSLPIASPWSSSNLERIVFEDIFGSDTPTNTRAAAMRLPGIARARNKLCAMAMRATMRELEGDTAVPEQPAWLTRTDIDATSPEHTLVWTVDDLIFYGWSCWWRLNNEDNTLAARGRIPMGEWAIEGDGSITVRNEPARPDDVILIPGIHEGILSFGHTVLDDAHTLYRNVRARLINPVPQLELHQVSGEDMDTEAIDAMIAGWSAARAGKNGGVGYTNKHIELKEHGTGDAQLMIEARNASAVDQARLVGVPAGTVDATAPKASLNYETQTGRATELVDDLDGYLDPIAARLSLDDVCAPGRRIAFDKTNLTALTPTPDVGPSRED